MFPKRAVASVVGIGGGAGSIGGILFPIYAGKLLDRFQASGNVTAGYAILFAFCGSAYLLAFGLGHLLAFGLGHLLAPRFGALQIADKRDEA
jgi:ACS family hexuronate transporter-like MFS transporter